MQSMFRLPWSTESPGDKIMEKAALHKSRPLPVVEMPNFMNKMKRKRTDSPEPAIAQHAHVVKKWKDANGEVKPAVTVNGNLDRVCVVDGVVEAPKPLDSQGNVPMVASTAALEARAKAQPLRKEGASKSKDPMVPTPVAKFESSSANIATPAMESDLTALQQTIEAQINYEILLKHNELRLIEQELAKCQVSLEQLRRCSLIPFPGTEGLSENVSGGVGASLQPPAGFTEPQFAAPWGVTDGPYTRHYARWLISDPKFDSMSERALAQQAHGYFGTGEGRTTRGSYAEFGSTGKARTSRTSTGTLKLQVLGENPAPAPKIDPLLHKRSTDGQWVRLYCAQCGHSNFSNTQGFLNHCRIKHNQVFKSHDQAAIACGVPVDGNEGGNPVTATEPTASAAATPAVTFPASTSGFVHPLIRANPPELAKDVHRDFNGSREPAKPSMPITKSNFEPSSSTPHLNTLLQKRGFEGSLKSLVDTARSKIDVDAMEISDDDLIDSALQTPVSAKPTQLTRLPVVAPNATLVAQPGSQLGHASGHGRLPLSLPPSALHSTDGPLPRFPVELSPNTVESNPGLVSDHDDDDDEDGDDAHSQPDVIMDDDVVVEDASDVEGVQERTGSREGLQGCFDKAEGSRKH
jgi:ADA HAT complex component 1